MSITVSQIDVTVGLTIGATTYNCLPSNPPLTNTQNLQKLLDLLVTPTPGLTDGSGGTLIFPAAGAPGGLNKSYQFNGPVTIGGPGLTRQPYSIIIRGDGQQQGSAPLLLQTAASDLFVVNTNDGTDDDDAGGVVFQDLMIGYSASPATAGNSAIRVTEKSAGTRLVRVSLFNWPVGANFNQCAEANMIDCRVIVNSSTIATTAVQIGDASSTNAAVETYISGCYFFDGTSLGTGMQVYGCEHLRVMNTRIEQYLNGIAITPGSETDNAKYLYFENVSCYPYSTVANTGGPALLIATSGSSSVSSFVFHATFVGCELSAPEATATKPLTKYVGPGVIIGHATGPKDAIDQIRFVDCHVCRWPGPGLQTLGGSVTNQTPTNIEVLGGYYSLNGSNASGGVSAGIAIIGGSAGPSGIRVVGAACNNSLFSIVNKGFDTPTQKYGIYVLNAAKNVRIVGCDLTDNTTSGLYVEETTSPPVNVFVRDSDFTGLTTPVTVVGSVTNLQVVDCPGYNDQGTLITNAIPTTGTPLRILQLGGTLYYGPAECYVTAPTTASAVEIDSQSTFLKSGSFYLQPLETIQLSTGTTDFVAIGK